MQDSEGITKTFQIPISHLDYEYVEKCTDVKELEKIYVTLKIGEEGKYPDLETFCEDKLKKLCPESRVLRKPTELKTLDQLDREQRDQLTQDFQGWLIEMQSVEEKMNKSDPTERGDGVPSIKNYPIRGKQTIKITEDQVHHTQNNKTNKSCKPKDYNEWSKIADQLEKELIVEEAEVQQSASKETKKEPEKTSCKKFPNLIGKVDTTGLTELEKEKLALQEKDKGNEAFRAGDLDEADIYYCRSLSIKQNIPVYNNRGLIYMKQKKWEEAIRDFNVVIKREPSNVKALARRANCYSEIHNLQDAIIDCQKVLKLSPNNKVVESLFTKCQEELQKRAQPKLKDGRRMVITEVGSDDEDSNSEDEVDNKKLDQALDGKVANEEIKIPEENVTKEPRIVANEDTSEKAFMALKDQGNDLFKELKYKEALALYDQLTRRWPSNPIGYRNKAACNLVLEQFEEVIKDCTTAIELDRTSHLSFYRRGKAYKILKQYNNSLKDLEEALSISPNHRQINEEVNEVKALLHEEKMSSEIIEDEVSTLSSSNKSSISDNNTDIITELSTGDVQRSSPVSGTWEVLDKGDFQSCSDKQDELENNIIFVDEFVKDSYSLTVATIERSITSKMTKYEFDKKLSAIKTKYDWSVVIQLLVDASPDNLVSLLGEKLEGVLLERIISSLVVYSSNGSHASFIYNVLDQLKNSKRFNFVKMMVSDHTVSEIEQLLDYLRDNSDNLALVDNLRLNYL